MALASAPTASAAGAGVATPVVVTTAVIAALASFAALWLLFERRTLTRHSAQLAERISHRDELIAELNVRRGEYERNLAEAQAELDETQAQRARSEQRLDALRIQIERVARVDALTGVANKTQFMETLDEEIKRAVRQKKPISVLMGELDFYDQYTGINGEDRAMAVLQTVAGSVSKTFRRAGDLVARVGQARFAIVLPEADLETGQRFAERLRQTVYDLCIPFQASTAADRVTISVGQITLPPTRLHERSAAIADVLGALRAAQEAGRNCTSLAADAA